MVCALDLWDFLNGVATCSWSSACNSASASALFPLVVSRPSCGQDLLYLFCSFSLFGCENCGRGCRERGHVVVGVPNRFPSLSLKVVALVWAWPSLWDFALAPSHFEVSRDLFWLWLVPLRTSSYSVLPIPLPAVFCRAFRTTSSH